MKPLHIVTLTFSALCASGFAQTGEGIVSGQTDALSLATGGQFAEYSVPDSTCIGLHAQRPFSLKALDRIALKTMLRLKPMDVHATFVQAGDEVLVEQCIQAGLGRWVSGSAYMNVRCGLYVIRTIQGESGHCAYADVGLLYRLTHTLSVGCRLFNPTGSRVKLDGAEKRLEQCCNVGLTFQPVRSVTFVLEEEKQPKRSSVTRFGLIYSLNRSFSVMGGLSGYPMQPSWGIGGQAGKIRYALGFRSHPALGLTSALSLSYQIRKTHESNQP